MSRGVGKTGPARTDGRKWDCLEPAEEMHEESSDTQRRCEVKCTAEAWTEHGEGAGDLAAGFKIQFHQQLKPSASSLGRGLGGWRRLRWSSRR